MAVKTLERQPLPTIQYEPGETVDVDLPRSHFYQRLNLLANWDVTVNTAGTPQNGYGILDLIDRVEVSYNGSQTIKSVSFASSHLRDWLDYGSEPIHDTLDLSSATNQTGQMQSFVDFQFTPNDLRSLVPSFLFSDFTLSIKWGTDADIADDVTVNSASVEVGTMERRKESMRDEEKGISPKDVAADLWGFKERQRTIHLDHEGQHEVRLPQGNVYYGIGLAVLDGDTPDNDIVEGIEVVQNGVTTHKDTTFNLARAESKQLYGVETMPDGYATLDYGRKGNLRDVVATEDMDSYELLLDTDGAMPTDPAEVRVTTYEIVQ